MYSSIASFVSLVRFSTDSMDRFSSTMPIRFRSSGFMVMFEGSTDCSKITLFEDFDDL